MARKIPAGSDIVLQMHYTTIGEPVSDQLQIGVIAGQGAADQAARRRPAARCRTRRSRFRPATPNYEVMAKKTFDTRHLPEYDVSAHARARQGRQLQGWCIRTASEEVLLSVPKYDFNWQMTYKLAEPKLLPKGRRSMVVGALRQLDGQRFNPDPTATVRWGDQTWEEMLIGYFGTVEVRADGQSRRPAAPAAADDRARRSRSCVTAVGATPLSIAQARPRCRSAQPRPTAAALFDRPLRAPATPATIRAFRASPQLRQRTPEAILDALTTGVMRQQGSELTRRASAALLPHSSAAARSAPRRMSNGSGAARADPGVRSGSQGPSWRGWGPDAGQRPLSGRARRQASPPSGSAG